MVALQSGHIYLKFVNYTLTKYGVLQFNGRIYVPDESDLKKIILQQMHNVPYASHLSYHKTITIVKKEFYCPGMKKEIARYIS